MTFQKGVNYSIDKSSGYLEIYFYIVFENVEDVLLPFEFPNPLIFFDHVEKNCHCVLKNYLVVDVSVTPEQTNAHINDIVMDQFFL